MIRGIVQRRIFLRNLPASIAQPLPLTRQRSTGLPVGIEREIRYASNALTLQNINISSQSLQEAKQFRFSTLGVPSRRVQPLARCFLFETGVPCEALGLDLAKLCFPPSRIERSRPREWNNMT